MIPESLLTARSRHYELLLLFCGKLIQFGQSICDFFTKILGRFHGLDHSALSLDFQFHAGEIGAGHTVTALYEIIPHGVQSQGDGVDPLKYRSPRMSSSESR